MGPSGAIAPEKGPRLIETDELDLILVFDIIETTIRFETAAALDI